MIIVLMMIIIGTIGAVFVSLINTEGFTAMNQSAGLLAFGVADAGVEFEQYNLAQNVDWYRSTADPMPAAVRTLGASPNAGSFTAQTFLPATKLRTRIPTAGAIAEIRVYTTDRFPEAGSLQIDDDITDGQTEFITYTDTTPNSFIGVITRDVLIGTVSGTASSHERGTRVYPVTTLLTALGTLGACTPAAAASFNIAAHPKFLAAGIIDIEGEEISYSGSTIAGGTMTLLGVTRCLNNTSAGHAINQPVTPLLVDGAEPDYTAEIISTGTTPVAVAGSANRVIRKTVQR